MNLKFLLNLGRSYDYNISKMEVVLETNLAGLTLFKRGKVRDIYEIENYLLLVATDRISAFDVVLPDGIPNKGRVLTQLSIYWFRNMEDIIPNHLVSAEIKEFPLICRKYADTLNGRSMLVKKTRPLPVECVVRGYLAGSGWKEYKEKGMVSGIRPPQGLIESSRLKVPIFTPSTKADEGHDMAISFNEMVNILGHEMANTLRDISLRLYLKAADLAEKRGIIIADTKFEFGINDSKLILIDEILTPDSSRFWSVKNYKEGKGQDSYDKQIVRDYLLTLDWDKRPPGPHLPREIVEKTAERYQEIFEILTR